MRDFVSSRWLSLAGLVASLAVVWSTFILYDFPWLTVLWVSLALSTAAVLIGRTPTPSVAQVINGIEGEPARALAGPSEFRFKGRKEL